MATKKQNATYPSPNTGMLLKDYLTKKRISKNALSRALNRNPSTLYDFLKNNTMQTCVLWDICVVLKYNFFQDMASQLPKDFGGPVIENHASEQIKELQQEILVLKAEKDLLERILKG